MTENLYSKENKATEASKINMRLAFLNDSLVKLEKEKIDIIEDMVYLKGQLNKIKQTK